VLVVVRNYVSLQEDIAAFLIFTPASHPLLSSQNMVAVPEHVKCQHAYLRYDMNVDMPTSNSVLTYV
jgi:hypothetical protein